MITGFLKNSVHATLRLFGFQVEKHGRRYSIRRRVVLGAGDYVPIVRLAAGEPRVILVVGAYHGAGAIHLIRAFPHATVYSFEPDPESFRVMAGNLRRFPTAVPMQMAVGAECGTATLNRNRGADTNSLLSSVRGSLAESVTHDSVEVPIITIDEFCKTRGIDRVDYIHVDLQGFEMQMLAGAEQLIRRGAIRLILLEVSFEPFYEGQPTLDQIYRFLDQRAYRFVCTQGMFFEPGKPYPRSGNLAFVAP